jgi:hypothetical protein
VVHGSAKLAINWSLDTVWMWIDGCPLPISTSCNCRSRLFCLMNEIPLSIKKKKKKKKKKILLKDYKKKNLLVVD